jgi:hypothetical protein
MPPLKSPPRSGHSRYSGHKLVNQGFCQKARARKDHDRHRQVFGVRIDSIGDDKGEQLGRHSCFDGRAMKGQGWQFQNLARKGTGLDALLLHLLV